MDWPDPGIDTRFIGLAIALALGLLVGLEREWSDDKPIGLRSFGLIGLLGGLAGLLIESFGAWPLGAGFLALGVLFAYQLRDQKMSGITTLVAGLVVYLLGAAAVAGFWVHATVLAGAVTVILHWKQPLHSLVDRLETDDLETIARFVLITLVILPVLPNETFGPFNVFNPFNTWLLVVLIVTINLAGYLAFRFVDPNKGGWIAGLLGGMVSSTATTFSYASLSQQSPKLGAVVAQVILVASTVVYARVFVEVAAVAPALLPAIVWPSMLFSVALLAIAGILTLFGPGEALAKFPGQSNPARIRMALAFGALFTLMLFAVAAAREWIGEDAVYGVAFLSGLSDVDALTLSMAKLHDSGGVGTATAWRAIFLATLANLAFKIGVACVLGSADLRRWMLLSGLPAIGFGVLVLVLWP